MSERPKPGIYEGVDFEEYLAWDAISNSRLSLFRKSPRAFKYGAALESRPYLQLGRLIHCGVLEESAFARRYAVCPDYHLDGANVTGTGERSQSKATKYVRKRVEEFSAAHEGQEIVSLEWYEATLAVVREIAANRDAYECFNGADGRAEISIVWDEGGLLCKARLDMVNRGRLVDLKSSAGAERFANAIANYGYHRQLAHYQRGWELLAGEILDPWIVVVESSSPHVVQAARLASEALQQGHEERAELIAEWRRCQRADDWPAKDNPNQWNLPAWYGERESVELVINGKRLEV